MPEQTHQLAAILFTDIVGYTSLMGEDEQKALTLLNKNREVHERHIPQYHGKLLKEIGDGILASFTSVSDAVYCALAIMEAVEKIQDLNLSIAIHLGEVVFQDNDVFGDGVNITSRIEKLTPPNSIRISEAVYRNIANKKDIKTEYIGKEQLKHVKEPIRIYEVKVKSIAPHLEPPPQTFTGKAKPAYTKGAFIGLGIAAVLFLSYIIYEGQWSRWVPETTISVASEDDISIAVLPFVNMSPDQDNQYFADGVMDAILNHLAKVESFHVISRTTMLKYRDHEKTIPEIGKELGVSYILEGSAQKYGQEIRITAQLVKAATDMHIWSNEYTSEFKEIFSLQSDIAQSITRELKITLNTEVKNRIESIPTTNMEAYNLYLQGKFELNRLTEEAFRLALKNFQMAIEKDPGFAAAYVGEASANLLLGGWFTSLQKVDFINKARSSALKALELDENLADAYMVLAQIKFLFEWDWDGANQMYKKGMELKPMLTMGRFDYAYYLAAMGRFYESIALSEQTIALDPLNPLHYVGLGHALQQADRNQEALEQYLKALELDPGSTLTNLWLAIYYSINGNSDMAVNQIEFLWDKQDELPSNYLGFMGYIYAKAGLPARTSHILDVLKQRENSDYGNTRAFAHIYIGLGEYDEALKYLNKAFQEKKIGMVMIKVTDRYDPLRSDPRFQTILKKMKFDQ